MTAGDTSVSTVAEKGLGLKLAPRIALRDVALVGVLAAMVVTLSVASPVFLTSRNLLNVLDQNAALAILAIGATIVVIAGGLDLSMGAIYGLAGVVAVLAANALGGAVGIGVGILVGAAVGAINGLLIFALRISSILATLGTSLAIGGIAAVINDGFPVSNESAALSTVGQEKLFGVSYVVWILLLTLLAAAYLLGRTRLGRQIYAFGGNAEAARLSGVRVGVVMVAVMALGGLAAGLAGTVGAARVDSAAADAGDLLLFPALAAVFVGGASIYGGLGSVWRTALGLAILALMDNGFNLLNIPSVYQPIIQGAIIIGAVGIDAWSQRDSRTMSL